MFFILVLSFLFSRLSRMASDNFPHDAAYKAFFSTPEMVKSLLEDFVSGDFIGDLDFDTLGDLEDEEDNIMLEQKFRQWDQEFIYKGKAEGLAEGLSCQKTTLLEMLSDRFGTISNEWKEAIARLEDAAHYGKWHPRLAANL